MLVLVGVAGCDFLSIGGGEEQTGSITVETNKQSYSETDRIEFAVRNATSDSVSLHFCNRLIFETQTRQDGGWTSYSGTICKDLYPMEYKPVVAPRGAYKNVTGIQDEGTYRLKLKYKRDSEDEKAVYSNAFKVE